VPLTQDFNAYFYLFVSLLFFISWFLYYRCMKFSDIMRQMKRAANEVVDRWSLRARWLERLDSGRGVLEQNHETDDHPRSFLPLSRIEWNSETKTNSAGTYLVILVGARAVGRASGTNIDRCLSLPSPNSFPFYCISSSNSIVTTSATKMTETGTLPIDEPDFGDFVKNEEEELDLEELVEPWYRYKTEGEENSLYPIFLGEMLNGRYLVEHKIGFGGGSTVWMAFDIQDKKNVALKVMRPGEWGVNEIRIQDEIKKIQDPSHLVTYIATFVLPRDHRVLVFPLMGPCIDPIDLKTIPMATRMSAAHQLLKTLANLHEAGIIHRGK
jgi:hypothetical protein